MKRVLQTALVALLCGCTVPASTVQHLPSDFRVLTVKRQNPAFNAFQYINYSENTHRQELKEFTGVDPKRTEWCAAFVNAVLEESDIPSNNNHKYPLTARAFLDWGTAVDTPEPGDVVVFPRGNQGWQGHVGFYIKTAEINGVEYYYILGGNQNNKVSIEMYRASRALGIRRQTPI
jgi:uncharacterized protein (TIGR02594 family)